MIAESLFPTKRRPPDKSCRAALFSQLSLALPQSFSSRPSFRPASRIHQGELDQGTPGNICFAVPLRQMTASCIHLSSRVEERVAASFLPTCILLPSSILEKRIVFAAQRIAPSPICLFLWPVTRLKPTHTCRGVIVCVLFYPPLRTEKSAHFLQAGLGPIPTVPNVEPFPRGAPLLPTKAR